jgi:hypothetical protein
MGDKNGVHCRARSRARPDQGELAHTLLRARGSSLIRQGVGCAVGSGGQAGFGATLCAEERRILRDIIDAE